MTKQEKIVISVQNLTKKFKHKIANDNLSFVVHKGERIGIVGANGSGKTTLVEQIVGVSKPTSGKISYFFPYHKTPQEKMGTQFQDSSYPDGLSVKDVIDFSLEIYRSNLDQNQLMKLLNVFKISDFYKSKAKGLSGGQQQKLNVFLAIAHGPQIVVLDEISTGLDIAAREEILNFIEKEVISKKITTLLVSHQMNEIMRLCKRIIVLNAGKILYDGPIRKIEAKYGSLNKYMQLVLKKELGYETK